MDAQQTLGKAAIAESFASIGADLQAGQSPFGLEGFGLQQQGSQYGMLSQRQMSAAQFDAQSGAWLERANYANSVSPTLAAYGVSPGVVSAGQKPEDLTGASYLGQLGSGAFSAARYADEGGAFFNSLNGEMSKLNAEIGYGALWGAYVANTRTPLEAQGEAIVNARRKPVFTIENDPNALQTPYMRTATVPQQTQRSLEEARRR